jgi:hypothetical protein
MTNHPLTYRRPAKWPIAAALAAAVLIHLSAVAIAFHQDSPATQPAAKDSTTIGVDLAADPRPLPQIPIFLSRRPYRWRQPISLNLRKLCA